jgi:hypothetical protein
MMILVHDAIFSKWRRFFEKYFEQGVYVGQQILAFKTLFSEPFISFPQF